MGLLRIAETGLEDLRYAFRSITRTKALTAVLLISLGIGTGANAAAFGIVDALLFGVPPGIAPAGSLVSIYTSQFSGAIYGQSSYPDYLSLRAVAPFGSVAAIDDQATARVEADGAGQLARIAGVTDSFFDTLRMRPHLGRLLGSVDAAASPQGAVISSELWTFLGQRGDILGSRLAVGDREYSVVGVAASKFRGLSPGRPSDVWVPLDEAARGSKRGDRRLSLVARLRPGVSIEQAQKGMDAIAGQLAGAHPETNRGTLAAPEVPRQFTAIRYSRLNPETRGQAAVVGAVVSSAVALLLISACVNAGSLLLSRAAARKRQLAVKMALGAPRERLVRQLLAESLLVALGGGAIGLLFATWTASAVPALFAPEHAAMLDTSLDAGLVLLTVGISCLAGTLFGIVPSFQATSAPAVIALRADSGEISEPQGGRLRGMLVVVQIALSTVLLIAAGFLTDSLSRALEGAHGLEANRVVVVPMEALWADAARGLLGKADAIDQVGWGSTAPLGRQITSRFRIAAGAPPASDMVDLDISSVTPGYFEALGLSLVEGRFFDDGDRTRTTPVAVVDEVLARRYFGAVAAGQYLQDESGIRRLIVGVARTGRYRTLQESPRPTVYVPLLQAYTKRGYLFVRTPGDPVATLAWIGETLNGLDPSLDVSRMTTLGEHLAQSLVIDRLTTTLVGVCGVLALMMSTIGVYGVMGDAVQRRTREIGLHVALGAGRSQVAKLVFSEVVHLTAAGLAVGVAGALLIARAVQALVHGATWPDAATLAATPALLAFLIGVTAVVPLRRALRVSPTIALRAE